METLIETISEISVSYLPKHKPIQHIRNSNEAYQVLKQLLPDEAMMVQEQFVILYINRANRVIGAYPMSKGGLTGTVADIRLILSVALKCLASGIILCHNHPSGNLKPSEQDIRLTDKFREACRLLDIVLLDHVIISNEGYYSFADESY